MWLQGHLFLPVNVRGKKLIPLTKPSMCGVFWDLFLNSASESIIECLRGKATFLLHLSLLRYHLPGATFILWLYLLLLLGQSLCSTATGEKHISIGKFSVSLKKKCRVFFTLARVPLFLIDISNLRLSSTEIWFASSYWHENAAQKSLC